MGCTVQSMLRSGRSVRILGCEVHSRGRTPHGVRGLKSTQTRHVRRRHESHPSRGAWIEIPRTALTPYPTSSHPSRGAWIEINRPGRRCARAPGRTPHGVRGLKCGCVGLQVGQQPSHPSRGAWIEIIGLDNRLAWRGSHPSRGAWIEMRKNCPNFDVATCRTPHGVRGLK